ncbi:unnamed protein product [Kluyveromyces dobzhanskii CBS 2104]|uniref:rRNA methyltransferase 2, mitochondrial n=1 Tax=Kluyveromyces dobzhanskii CBS 2104 TaxID=1427455 RepID=A0A0A8KZC8_9SACH|nr:unnamed protein product [Kluyveromyces dobzhanskii CBS 2104]
MSWGPQALPRCLPRYRCPVFVLRFARHNSNAQNRWLARQKNDHFTKAAKEQNFRSRAAFKLMDIDDKYRFFKKNQKVLDLGFAPGAWSQVARNRIGTGGMVMGVDLLRCAPPKGVHSLQANILSKKTHELIRLCFARHVQLNKHDELHKDHGYLQHMLEEELNHLKETEEYKELYSQKDISKDIERYPVDVVLSDMMANATGVQSKDHYMSMDLCDAALIVAIDLLKPGGSFTCKLYAGSEDRMLENRLKKVFKQVDRFKPQASRNESRELYLVGRNKKKDVDKLKVFLEDE